MIRAIAAARGDHSAGLRPIVRARVVERLTRSGSFAVLPLIAPAGFGKTLAVGHFLAQQPTTVLQVTLRREHASPAGFVRALGEAAAPYAPRLWRALAAAVEAAPRNDHLPALGRMLAKVQGTIVLDDFQRAGYEPSVCAALADVIERSGEALRWIVIARRPLTLPLASWVAYGRSELPVDEADLRLEFDEARAIAAASGARLRDADVAALYELAGGWPAAFGFGLRAALRASDVGRALPAARELIYHYLHEQIFGDLTPEERDFMLETVALPALDPVVLRAGGWDGPETRIDDLRTRVPLVAGENDDAPRYAPLVKEFLEHELRRRGRAGRKAAILRAAGALESAGRGAEALALYALAEEWERLAQALRAHGFDWIECGAIVEIEASLAALPAEMREGDARLLGLGAATEAFWARYEEADARFSAARQLAGDAAVRADLTQRHGTTLIRQLRLGEALELFDAIEPRDVSSEGLRARISLNRSAALALQGRHEEALRLMEEGLACASRSDEDIVRAMSLQTAGFVAFQTGRHTQATQLANASASIAHRAGFHGVAARAGLVASLISYENCDYAELNRLHEQIRRDAERSRDPITLATLTVNEYQFHAERGDLQRLVELAERLDTLPGGGFAYVETLLPSIALQSSWNGDFVASLERLRGTAEQQKGAPRRLLRLSETALYAAAAGERVEAEDLTKTLLEGLTPSQKAGGYLTTYIVKARIIHALTATLLGRAATAHNVLRELEADAPLYPGSLRAFIRAVRAAYAHVETGAGQNELGHALDDLRRVNMGGYSRLIEVLPFPTAEGKGHFSTLTRGELQVLRALGAGETSRIIADRMSRSPMTVDAHVKSIVRKLGCSGRREAIALARAHGIV